MKHSLPLFVLLVGLVAPRAAAAQDGAALYKELCSSCHDTAVDRAPSREALRSMSPQRILESLEAGPMVTMTQLRTAAERRAIAEYASGRSFGTPFSIAPAPKAMCTTGRGTFTMTAGRAGMERLRSEPVQYALPVGARGRPLRRRRAAPEVEVGVRPAR